MTRLKILFSKKYEWEKSISEKLKEYEILFRDFDEVNLDEYDITIPLSLDAQRFYNDSTYKLLYKIIVPSNHCINLCHDKLLFNQFLIEKGYEDFVPKKNGISQYPFILKPRIGAWGKDISIIRNMHDEIKNAHKIQSSEYFKQEYINGDEEYTTHIIIKDSKIVFMATLRFNFNIPQYIKGKETQPTKMQEVDHSQFRKLFSDILVSMSYQGICCFNYKVIDGQLLIFEINPRYGGTMTYFIREALPSLINCLSKKS